MPRNKCGLLAAVFFLLASNAFAKESACFGSVSNGRLESGVQLPSSGPNFSAYSSVGVGLGRTYVHSTVRNIVLATYKTMEKTAPDTTFVYGETGWASGGRIRPHRTHQNGTSVDFFVPVRNKNGQSVSPPISIANKLGYNLEFDAEGRYEDLTIDLEAIGEHLFQLQQEASAQGAPIALVIFDPRYLNQLFQTKHGAHLKKTLKFMEKDAWVRHDEHYHVNFEVKCGEIET